MTAQSPVSALLSHPRACKLRLCGDARALVRRCRRWREQRRLVGAAARNLFSFCANPFILDAAAKSRILQIDAGEQMGQQYSSAMLASLLGGGAGDDASPYFVLNIRRDHLLEDALQGIVGKPTSVLKRPLKVKFAGEEGIDAGGVRKEFFSLMTRQLFTPDFGMFLEDTETRFLWFNGESMEANIQFELVGGTLESMRGEWSIDAHDHAISVSYHAEIVPGFALPPLIGSAVMSRNVKAMVEGVTGEIHRRTVLKTDQGSKAPANGGSPVTAGAK